MKPKVLRVLSMKCVPDLFVLLHNLGKRREVHKTAINSQMYEYIKILATERGRPLSKRGMHAEKITICHRSALEVEAYGKIQ